MSQLIRYEKPRGSIHVLQELAGLSDVPDQLLIVSERTLSIINDFARIDVGFLHRYVKEFYEEAYEPVDPEDDEAAIVRQLQNNFELEVMPVSEVDLYGWYASAWQKQNLIPGYAGAVLEKVLNSDMPAGSYNMDLGAVPAGRVHVYDNVNVYYTGTVANVTAGLRLVLNVNEYAIHSIYAFVSQQRQRIQGPIYVPAGGFLRVAWAGATAHDSASLTATGRFFEVNQ